MGTLPRLTFPAGSGRAVRGADGATLPSPGAAGYCAPPAWGARLRGTGPRCSWGSETASGAPVPPADALPGNDLGIALARDSLEQVIPSR